GLEGLYKDFVDFCGTEIVTALKLMAQPSNYPLLVHCTQGKDRTGLVIAMALSCAEVPLEQIICDFARSNEGLDSQREIMILEMAKGGLHPSFVDAPADTLRSTFAYIQGKYGSVSDYLSQNGFGKDWQQQLRK
ncbi:protein-tyrosine phosphatase-like protein, partial [Gaertneriomyces semiglobifer]